MFITSDQAAEIQRRLEAGETVQGVSFALGVARESVRKFSPPGLLSSRKGRVYGPARSPELTPAQRGAIRLVELRDVLAVLGREPASIAEVAARLAAAGIGCTEEQAARMLGRAGGAVETPRGWRRA